MSIFFWLVFLFVDNVSSSDCRDIESILSPPGNCRCSNKENTELVLSNCRNVRVKFNSHFYSVVKSELLLTIKSFSDISLASEESENITKMREINLVVQDGNGLTVIPNTFNEIVINAHFKNVSYLKLYDKSFASCWGNVWLINTSLSSSSGVNPFSSSDMNVWNDTSQEWNRHKRPKVTPLQRLRLTYDIVNKIEEIEITIYAILALCGAIIVTLIALTVCVATKSGSVSSRSDVVHMETLPDVIPRTPTPPKATLKTTRNPVIKVSRISKVFRPKQHPRQPAQTATENKYQRSPRPPLPLPKNV